MRLIFAGTPAVALPSLRALNDSEHEIAAVITRLDAPVGRKKILTPSPVAALASELGIPTVKANRLGDDVTTQVANYETDLGIIVAFGGLVREPLLSIPSRGWINLHFSLLPRWRGAAPVQHSLLTGDAETGACVFQLVASLDAGPVFDEVSLAISPNDTAGDLLETLSSRGATLLRSVVDDIARGTTRIRNQSGEITLAPKLTIDDGRIPWDESMDQIYNRIRAVTPEPGAFTEIGERRIKILRAQPGEDTALAPGTVVRREDQVLIGTATTPIELIDVQPSGKKAMSALDWWRGLSDTSVSAQ